MSRLFITPREIHLINDLTKEFIKDVVGQYIIYYPVSTMKTMIDPIYDEAVQKIFESPIKIDALVGQPERYNNNNNFGTPGGTNLEVLIQARDLIDKNVKLSNGDFFVYGNETFEIIDLLEEENIFGQDEYSVNWKIQGHLARAGQLDMPAFKQLLEDAKVFKDSKVQKHFEQQRGYKETEEAGNTGDVRQVRERLKEDMPPIALGEGPRDIEQEDNEKASTFDHSTDNLYDDF